MIVYILLTLYAVMLVSTNTLCARYIMIGYSPTRQVVAGYADLSGACRLRNRASSSMLAQKRLYASRKADRGSQCSVRRLVIYPLGLTALTPLIEVAAAVLMTWSSTLAYPVRYSVYTYHCVCADTDTRDVCS